MVRQTAAMPIMETSTVSTVRHSGRSSLRRIFVATSTTHSGMTMVACIPARPAISATFAGMRPVYISMRKTISAALTEDI